jgi:DNA-binding transcriptional ArsR family regulator
VTVFKAGDASTIDLVKGVRQMLPRVAQTLPPDLKIQPLSDQSTFVRGSINGVIREAIIAAVLTGLMILIFLGSWRSTVIIAISIPLSILTSVMVLSFLHETINIMTLGGLALAVGILVDDATVTIENIERHLEEGAALHDGILDGAAQISVQRSDYTPGCSIREIVFFISCDRYCKYNVRMELRQIRSFLSIAETLHFGRTAELIHLSQPALSLQIRALEEEVGVRLFERDRRKTTLTAAGLAFRDDATAAVSQLEQAIRRARLAAESVEACSSRQSIWNSPRTGWLPTGSSLPISAS